GAGELRGALARSPGESVCSAAGGGAARDGPGAALRTAADSIRFCGARSATGSDGPGCSLPHVQRAGAGGPEGGGRVVLLMSLRARGARKKTQGGGKVNHPTIIRS